MTRPVNLMGLWRLEPIRIVLVEPAGPLNVGATARVMKNMGLHQLILVNPQCDPQCEQAQHMAVHARDLLAAARIVGTLSEALVGCQRAIATTGRLHPQDQPLEAPEAALPWLLSPMPNPNKWAAALIFGPEDRGLSNAELIYAQRWVRIPVSDAYPSLNLAQAVAICAYVLHDSAQGRDAGMAKLAAQSTNLPPPRPDLATPPQVPLDQAPLDQMEGFYQDLESLLLKIGYLYPHTAASRMAKLRRLLQRAEPNSQELAMLRGVLRQVNWAIASEQSSGQSPDQSLKQSSDQPEA